MTEKFDLFWRGVLTIGNVQKVADLIFELLDGKKFTFVTANEGYKFRPEVKTGQRLKVVSGKEKAINVYYDKKGNKFAGFDVSSSGNVWSCDTNLKEGKDEYDPHFDNPFLEFEGNKVTITQRVPAGHLLYWVVAIEKE